MTREQTFERSIQVSPPFDKRTNDPKTNGGIGAMELRFILKGAKGATQFVFYNGMGDDIGYHSYKPQYEGHTAMRKTCDILGCACYYDGSSQQASEFEDEFLREGEPAVWRMLEERYHSWFEKEDK